MKLIVGLGNPGAEYVNTKHNVGFDCVEVLAREHSFPAWKVAKKALVSKGRIAGEETLLVQPQTFMNLSGEPTGALMRYYKVAITEVICIHDELDFDPGEFRIKNGGGHGGHNGLKSLFQHCGRDFIRFRIGIGKPRPGRGADWVLSRFSIDNRSKVDEAIVDTARAVESLLAKGLPKTMNQTNRRV